MQTIAATNESRAGTTYNLWTNLRWYPTCLLLYAGGISGVAAESDAVAYRLLAEPRVPLDSGSETLPVGVMATPGRVMELAHGRQLPFLENDHVDVPMSEHLFQILREPLRTVARADTDYEAAFNRYEYIAALIQADLTREGTFGPTFYVGRFGWISRWPGRRDVVRVVNEEVDRQAAEWPLLKAGAFGGEPDRVVAAIERVAYVIERLPW